MNKLILPLLAATAMATPALAAPTITFNSANTNVPTTTTAQIFENFESGTNGVNYTGAIKPVPGTTSIATETGSNDPVVTGSIPGFAAQLGSNTNKYLAVQGGGIFTVSFSTPVQFFSFLIGSIDAYNNVKLVLTDGTTVGGPNGLSGAAIINQAIAFNSTGNSSVAGRVSYDFNGGAGLSQAIFSSTNDSLEIDDLAAAVPEAATWAMMMVGLGIVGGAVRRRKTKVSVSYAAA